MYSTGALSSPNKNPKLTKKNQMCSSGLAPFKWKVWFAWTVRL